jgi:transcriptional regulator with XRE-family HTH domain
MLTTNKQTNAHFRSLRREKGLTLQEVANAAGFSSTTDVYLFEIGAIVPNKTKLKIIQAFAHLTGQPYTLSDFTYAPEEQPTIVTRSLGWSQGREA